VPPLVRRYIKTGFVFLLLGLLVGAWILVAEFVLGTWPPRLVVTAHVHLLLVGFLLLLVMGVATWMFPRPARDDPRYRPALAEAVYWMVTVATALRALGELATAYWPTVVFRALVTLGGLGQLVGAGLFVLNIWPRVRMPQAPPPTRSAEGAGTRARDASITP